MRKKSKSNKSESWYFIALTGVAALLLYGLTTCAGYKDKSSQMVQKRQNTARVAATKLFAQNHR